jgi:hypothetical protein
MQIEALRNILLAIYIRFNAKSFAAQGEGFAHEIYILDLYRA